MILSAAFVISFGLSALKLLEIGLSQRQQKAIQNWLETLALQLSYLDLSTWIRALKKTKVELALAGVTLLCGYVSNAFLIARAGGDFGAWAHAMVTDYLGIMVMQAVLVMALFPIELKWLAGLGTIPSFLKRVGLVFAVYILLFIGTRVWHWDIMRVSNPQIRLLIVIPVVIPFSVSLYSAAYVLLIKLLQGGLFIVTRILWRVVEYPKGAWTALLFIATAILGIAQTIVASRH